MTNLYYHPDFIKDVVELETGELKPEKRDGFFQKYVPEYANFRAVNLQNFNFDEFYFALRKEVSIDKLTQSVVNLINLNQIDERRRRPSTSLSYKCSNELKVQHAKRKLNA